MMVWTVLGVDHSDSRRAVRRQQQGHCPSASEREGRSRLQRRPGYRNPAVDAAAVAHARV